MRDIKTLLQILLDAFLETPKEYEDYARDQGVEKSRISNFKFNGMCHANICLRACGLITIHEELALDAYMHSNKPKGVGTCYWWMMNKYQPRIDWLKKQINKL